jgi:predicted N-acetyltransferase YhbS
MDGTTWRRYRLVTRRGTEPPFFLEPDNPDDYPAWFEAAGFSPLARYYSNLDPDLGWGVPDAVRQRLERGGITIRPLDPADFTGELERIYDISIASFRNNFLYSPISRDEFLALYTRIRPVVQPELVLFAERAGEPVGFIFAVGDQLNRRAGELPETVIIKSLAVLPAWNGKGIGALLMAEVTAGARALGYRRGIHALMHEENRSRSLSGHHGTVMREYALFSRRL